MGPVKRLVGVGVVLAAITAVLFYVPSDHYLFLPHPAQPLDPLISVEGEEAEAGDDGDVYMVDILVRKAVLIERLYPGIESGSSLVPEDRVNPLGVSESERRQESLNEMSRSQQVAVAVALRSLEMDVEVERSGAEVVAVVPGKPAEGRLEAGDVIVDARGRSVTTPRQLVEAMERVRPGDEVELTVVRDGKRRALRVGTTEDERDAERAVLGVQVQQAAEFEFPVDVKIDSGGVGGPSAGLAFALEVVEELSDDVTRGRRVAVTGTVDLDGVVGAVGGVKQKTIGAREADADVFVVPDGNAAEARRHADGLEIVAVSTFDEALSALSER
jgi:Lon-like protease